MIQRAYYGTAISNFLFDDPSKIFGELAKNHRFAVESPQRNSWLEEIEMLKESLRDCADGYIFLEFSIPRMGKRVDIVLLIGGIIFVVEYKAGADTHSPHSIDQVIDYALDLKNFHEGSHRKRIAPILLSTEAVEEANCLDWSDDLVANPLRANRHGLFRVINQVLTDTPVQEPIDGVQWANSRYRPTPTIVEAAQALYAGHSVEEISRSDAGENLMITTRCIADIIESSRNQHRKSICFVTGVPGAGKTLIGLNIANRKFRVEREEHAVFLSGNGPLVDVLREGLARDEVERTKARAESISKRKATSKVSTFIQNVHHFRDEFLTSEDAPIDHVVVFDEAQRAWTQVHAEKFMIQKRGQKEFLMSEPEFLISVMDRRSDWCTVICLVGGGQEINTGEAGLTEWFDALGKRFRHWDAYYSPAITQKEYSWEQDLLSKLSGLKSKEQEGLHLAVSMRSYRAEKVSDFVGALIDGDVLGASHLFSAVKASYPIALTREIAKAREWLKTRARGNERYGLVASSGASRLKPEGINVKAAIDPTLWFLNGKDDVRSSYYLEDVATEFDIQGLELDWAAVCWDADFRRVGQEWCFHAFKGTRWQRVADRHRRIYLANAYRVLLTRARQGMVLFLPKGDAEDETRLPSFYDETYEYLSSCGVEIL